MKIGIVGAGFVGSTAAFAMVMSERRQRDRHRRSQRGACGRPGPGYHPRDTVRGVDRRARRQLRRSRRRGRSSCSRPGVSQKPGETRIQLLDRNAAVFADIIPKVLKAAPDTILLVATNPVDVMTQIATRISGLPPARVIGSGTILDTARFRSLLAAHLGIASHSIHAYVLGEHGDSEVLMWSSAPPATSPSARSPLRSARRSPLRSAPGSTPGSAAPPTRSSTARARPTYGIGAGLARLADVILGNERAVLTVSTVTAPRSRA